MSQIIEDLKKVKQTVSNLGKDRINSMNKPIPLDQMIDILKPYAEMERLVEKQISKAAKQHTIPKSSTLNKLT